MEKLSEEKLEGEYITDGVRVYEVVVAHPRTVSMQDIGTFQYRTIRLTELELSEWRKLDRALIASAA